MENYFLKKPIHLFIYESSVPWRTPDLWIPLVDLKSSYMINVVIDKGDQFYWDGYVSFYGIMMLFYLTNIRGDAQSAAEAVEYIDCISSEGYDLPYFPTNEGPDSKQSDGKVSVTLELWGMQSTSSFPSIPGSL